MLADRPSPKLLACANSQWNLSHFRGDLLATLQEDGFRIELAAPPAPFPAVPDWPLHPVPIASDGLNVLQDGLVLARLTRLLARVRPAAFLSWTAKPNIYGALAAGLLGIPAIPNVSGLGTAFIRGGPLQLLLSNLYRLAFARAPVVFFQNREDLQLFVDRRLVRSDQARLVPGSGVDLERFRPQPAPIRGEDETVLLFVGRLLGDKGVRELASAARLVKARAPGVRFQLLGATGAENRTAIAANEVAGWVDQGLVEHLGTSDDVRPHLAAADAIVLPSYREGLPRSLLEAAATARPMLASDVPGNRELVTDGRNGLLFKARSAGSLAEACLRFVALPASEKQRMGMAARSTVEERFSKQHVIAAYRAALADVLGRANMKAGMIQK